jgi:glycosyltransferase involved in cell wall biosynthesis
LRKRILQFIGSFNQGGTERQALNLTSMLKNEGSLDVYAATLDGDGVLKSEAAELGLDEIPEFRLTSFYNANFVRQVRRCAEYLSENKIDLVHTHDFYTNVFGMAAASLAGVPVRIASKRETTGVRSRGQEFVEKIAFSRADVVVANSEAVRHHLIGSGIDPCKVRIVHNGIDIGRFDERPGDRPEICRSLGLPLNGNAHFVTLVANLRHEVKNVPMLLRAAKRIVDNRGDTHFVVAGEGELEAGLREMADNLGIFDRVHFIGRCMDVPGLLNASYACVMTSDAEGFSNSILEYMAAAKPVVATGVGGAGEVIQNGSTGYIVAVNDDEAMAERLIDLFDNEAKAAAFGKSGRDIVRDRFSAQSQLENTLDLYHSILHPEQINQTDDLEAFATR